MNLGMESETLEFKASTSERREACESIAAMINKRGYGTLYFGVLDNGETVGQIVTDSTMKEVTECVSNSLEPKVIPTYDVIPLENGKSLIKLTFSGSQTPYSSNGKFLIRAGTQNRKLTREELILLVRDAHYSLDWEKESSGKGIEELDEATMKRFYQEAVNCGRLEMGEYSKTALLSALGIYNGEVASNAAYALFGSQAGVSLKIACFATDAKITFTDLKMFKGNIYNLIEEAMNYIQTHIDWRVRIDSLARSEIPEIPLRALREMVINAFAHANYRFDPEIEINIHPGKITIFNPGNFPFGLSPLDYVKKDLQSIKRNPLILDVLFRCKDVEKTGTGFKRMNRLCEEAGVKWGYENFAFGFVFIFYRNKNKQTETVFVQRDDLSPYELNVLNEIKRNVKISQDELSEKLNKSKKTIQRLQNSLIEKGYLVRIGRNQYGYWEVLDKTV